MAKALRPSAQDPRGYIGRNIRDFYDPNDIPRGKPIGELMESGDVDRDDYLSCFTVLPRDTDAYLREAYGDAYGADTTDAP